MRRMIGKVRNADGAGRPLSLLALLALLALPLPRPAGAQVVRGRLLDNESGQPVVNGTVALRDTLNLVVANAGTDETGAFTLTAPGPGVYSLLAVGMGYRSTPSGSLQLAAGEEITLDLHLIPRPLELDPLSVEARRRRMATSLAGRGFYERQRQGAGSFLTPEMISRYPAIYVGDILRHAPFVYSETNMNGSVITVNRGGQVCRPSIYVDDMKINSAPENYVAVEDIRGVEVYRGVSQIPAQYASLETCGVILIWTRR